MIWITHLKIKWWERIAAKLQSDSSKTTILEPMTGRALKMMVKHSIHRKKNLNKKKKTKYVYECLNLFVWVLIL